MALICVMAVDAVPNRSGKNPLIFQNGLGFMAQLHPGESNSRANAEG